MTALWRALHAELLKLKRTLAVRMIFVAPLLVALLQFFIGLNQRRVGSGFKLWDTVFQSSLSVWAIFMLPLLITLETALLASIEHNEKQWKHLLALPVSRVALYLAKFLIALLLALLSTLVLGGLLILVGYGLMKLRPEYASAGGPNLSWLLTHLLKLWLASWLIVALHTWISLRWASVTVALGAGIAGTFFALFAASARIGKFYPWLLPVNTLSVISTENRAPFALWLGTLGAVVVLALSCWEFTRREAGDAETSLSRKTLWLGGAAVLGLAVLGLFLQNPKAEKAQAESNPRIARVENGLLPAVTLKGQNLSMSLAERMEHYRVPGVSLAVINDGKIEWTKSYGVREAGGDQAVTPETVFQAASISKPVTAVAALALVQQGKLQLDANVNRWLKTWRVPDNEFTAKEKITLRRLLSHTAGLDAHKYPGYEADAPLPDNLQIFNGTPPAITEPIRLERVPGSAFHYSGGGYFLTQQLLGDVTGQAFPNLLQELVFTPLQMQRSTFAPTLPANFAANAASGHGTDGQVIKGRWHRHPELAAAGLWTTPTDLARFALALWQSFQGQAEPVLNTALTRQMLTKQLNDYGLGMSLRGQEKLISFSHEGSNIGYKCALVFFVETGQGAVVMTNGEHGGTLFGEILRSLARAYGWPAYRPVEREPVTLNPAVLTAYVGAYEINQDGNEAVIQVTTADGKLYLQVPNFGAQKIELYPLADDRFFMLEENAELHFIKDAQGHVTALQSDSATEHVTANRLP